MDFIKSIRAVARSENPGGLVELGGDNVSPLVEIGLTDLPNIGGATLRWPCDAMLLLRCYIIYIILPFSAFFV